jgi:hypothetical protein
VRYLLSIDYTIKISLTFSRRLIITKQDLEKNPNLLKEAQYERYLQEMQLHNIPVFLGASFSIITLSLFTKRSAFIAIPKALHSEYLFLSSFDHGRRTYWMSTVLRNAAAL